MQEMNFKVLQDGFKAYIKGVRSKEWTRLKAAGFWNIRHYAAEPINTGLLLAAHQYWDPETNVFRFGKQELCPMIEEFFAIMGVSFDHKSKVAAL